MDRTMQAGQWKYLNLVIVLHSLERSSHRICPGCQQSPDDPVVPIRAPTDVQFWVPPIPKRCVQSPRDADIVYMLWLCVLFHAFSTISGFDIADLDILVPGNN